MWEYYRFPTRAHPQFFYWARAEGQINPIQIAHPNHSHIHHLCLEFHMGLQLPETQNHPKQELMSDW